MNNGGQLTPPISQNDHTIGPMHAPFQILEFGDYECPYCGQAEPAVQQVIQQLGDQLVFAFRNFPLVQIHPYALSAAFAAEAAGGQGKFWEMHDLLYQHQNALTQSDLIGYARDLDLDIDTFSSDLENRTYLPKIESDVRSGEESGVPGTPTFFVNGEMYQGPVTAEGLIDAVRAVRR